MDRLTITDLKEIINGHRSYSYSEQDTGDAVKSFNFLESFSKNNLVYGVNTGFGPMADLKLSDGTIVLGEQIVKDIRDQGSVIVFDSRDWHRVTPCTKGTRYSIVCWTVGPNFI
jgi:hypothetical protein